MSRSCSVCGQDGIGMTTKVGGSIRSCAPRPGQKKWSTSVATRCTQGSPGQRAYVRWEGHPSRQDAETDKGQPGKPNARARLVAKEYKTHARPELYASTPPLEALKIVLSEIATGKRGGKVVALVDVRGAYFYALARRRVFVELLPEELASTLSDLKLTRGIACPCVWRGCIKGEDIVATVHGDDITIGGERSGGGTPHQNDIKKIRD